MIGVGSASSSISIGLAYIASADITWPVLGFDSAVLGSNGTVLGLLELFPTSISISVTSDSCLVGIKFDSNLGEGLINGFLRCSNAIPGRIACRDDPSLDKTS